MEVNYAENVAQIPTKKVDLLKVFESIKNPKKSIQETVDIARRIGKGCPEYDKIKKRLPCVYFNFHLDGVGMSDSNVLKSTGLLYLDIDNIKSKDELTSLKEDLKKVPYVFAMWNSVSAVGVSALIRVGGMTPTNYQMFVEYIKAKYKFKFDSSCFSKSRKTFLSYDRELYFNNSCKILNYKNIKNAYSTNISIYTSSKKEKEKIIEVDDTSIIEVDDTFLPNSKTKPIRYNNKKDFQTGSEVQVYSDGVSVVEVELKIKYREGKRHTGLLADGVKILYLNPHIKSFHDFRFHMHNLNRAKCQPALTDQEVVLLAKRVFDKRGEYKPKETKRKYIVNRSLIPDSRDAQRVVANLVNANKRESTLEKLKNVYLDGMTQKDLSKATGLGIATIKRYWKNFKK